MERRKDGIEKEGLDELAVRLGHLAGSMEAAGKMRFEHWEDLIDVIDEAIDTYYNSNAFDCVDAVAIKLFLDRFGVSKKEHKKVIEADELWNIFIEKVMDFETSNYGFADCHLEAIGKCFDKAINELISLENE